MQTPGCGRPSAARRWRPTTKVEEASSFGVRAVVAAGALGEGACRHEVTGEIGRGLLVLVGVGKADEEARPRALAKKVRGAAHPSKTRAQDEPVAGRHRRRLPRGEPVHALLPIRAAGRRPTSVTQRPRSRHAPCASSSPGRGRAGYRHTPSGQLRSVDAGRAVQRRTRQRSGWRLGSPSGCCAGPARVASTSDTRRFG